jgi:hypothetical protein
MAAAAIPAAKCCHVDAFAFTCECGDSACRTCAANGLEEEEDGDDEGDAARPTHSFDPWVICSFCGVGMCEGCSNMLTCEHISMSCFVMSCADCDRVQLCLTCGRFLCTAHSHLRQCSGCSARLCAGCEQCRCNGCDRVWCKTCTETVCCEAAVCNVMSCPDCLLVTMCACGTSFLCKSHSNIPGETRCCSCADEMSVCASCTALVCSTCRAVSCLACKAVVECVCKARVACRAHADGMSACAACNLFFCSACNPGSPKCNAPSCARSCPTCTASHGATLVCDICAGVVCALRAKSCECGAALCSRLECKVAHGTKHD